MKDLMDLVDKKLQPLGYNKKGNAFWKIEEGFYKLVDFQKGAHGGGYFFVNICVHPLGLPELLTNQLSIADKPKEFECIFRQRIEQVVTNGENAVILRGLIALEDKEKIQVIINSLPNDVEQWLKEWGAYEKLAKISEDEILKMLTVVPILKKKAYLMLKFYCTLKIGDKQKANNLLEQYMETEIKGLTFPQVDNYLKTLVES